MGTNMRNGKLFGFVGVGIISLGIMISVLFYEGRTGERYSFLNHFVSELGEQPWSRASGVFNAGLLLGSIFVLLLMISLWPVFNGWFGKLIVVGGIFTSVSGGLVGIFPMNNLEPHIDVAITFFYAGLVVTILFSIYVFTGLNRNFPRWVAVPGVFSFVCFFVFLFLTDPIIPQDGSFESIFFVLDNRPPILETAIFEWAVILSIIIWIFTVSLTASKQKSK